MKQNYKFRPLRFALAVCLAVLITASGTIFAFGEENIQPDLASASEYASLGDFTYTVENGTVTITGYTNAEGHVSIPSEINKMPVTTIGKDAFYSNTDITEVTLPDTIETIKSGAFYGCENLKKINIPQSVTVIENNAFTDCTSLEEITIPKGVLKIEPWTFSGCTNLAVINIPESVTEIGYAAFENTAYFNNRDNWDNHMLYLGNHLIAVDKDIEQAILRDETKSITNSVFAECKNLTEIEVTPNVEIIGICTFDGCTNLEEIIISEGIKTIDKSAFQCCENLTNVTIPETVTSIEFNAFQGCTNLSIIYIPENVTYIDETAFDNCPNLTIYGVKGSYAERYAKENNIKFIGENITTLGDYSDDNVLSIEDATLLQRKLTKKEAYDTLSIANYDFNGDGEFNVIDVTTLQMLIAG